MSIDLSPLDKMQRLLFEIPLRPLQGHRFQPTGFPGLGAATFETSKGTCLLVESPQSMANRLELTIWDEARQDVKAELEGLSHVRVARNGDFLTDTILESHRLSSPYLLEESSKEFFNRLKGDLGGLETGPIDRRRLARVLLEYDVGSLLHGVFLAKKDLAGGRLRVARAVSAFVEADGVHVAPSGGVKNDHVNPSGDTKAGFGNVPFARDDFTAERITLYVNVDLSQIRGYGLDENEHDPNTPSVSGESIEGHGRAVERMLILLALYKLRALLDGGLRLRTACDLRVEASVIKASLPPGFELPALSTLQEDLKASIQTCQDRMEVAEITFNDELKKGKERTPEAPASDASDDKDEG